MHSEESQVPRPAFAVLIAIAAGALALAMRTVTAGRRIQDGVPMVAPFDDLYHWKRIAFSAANFPAVLELDPDRGLRGAFCPWPPLYDLAAAAIARALGATGSIDVLRTIVWIPPFFAALLVALTIVVIGRSSRLAALLVAVPLACGPFLVVSSWIGTLDHHFLEPFLVLGILGGTILVLRAERFLPAAVAAALLATAMTLALFVQTATIIAAGLSFLCILALAQRRPALAGGTAAFLTAAAVVLAYRMTRPAEYPGGPWFLGFIHAALLAAAATALASALLLVRRNGRSAASVALPLVAGALVAAIHPDAAAAVASGLTFFAGDPWLATIHEFQPVWRPLHRLPNYVGGLGLAAVASIALVIRSRRGAPGDAVIAIFAMVFITATLPSRRFAVISTALGAVATAVLLARIWPAVEQDGGLRRAIVAGAALLLVAVPPLQFASWWIGGVDSGMAGAAPDFLRAASLMRERKSEGRALVPWSYGHMFDVVGERAVVVDNFGSMPDAEAFRIAHVTLLSRDEAAVIAYCDRAGIRYVVLDDPARGISSHVQVAGLPLESYLRNGQPTAYARSTWYWRARSGSVEGFQTIARVGPVTVLERIRR